VGGFLFKREVVVDFDKDTLEYLYHDLLYTKAQISQRFGLSIHKVKKLFKEWNVKTIPLPERARLERNRDVVQARVFILMEIDEGKNNPQFVKKMGGQKRVEKIVEKIKEDPRYPKENPEVILNPNRDP